MDLVISCVFSNLGGKFEVIFSVVLWSEVAANNYQLYYSFSGQKHVTCSSVHNEDLNICFHSESNILFTGFEIR